MVRARCRDTRRLLLGYAARYAASRAAQQAEPESESEDEGAAQAQFAMVQVGPREQRNARV